MRADGQIELRLERTWNLADEIFHDRLKASAALERPIELRNPFLFYEGHLPSFAWKKTADALDLARFNEDFDDLFERGMDPDVDDPMRCHRHSEAPEEWPSPDEVVQYKSRVRSELRTGDRLSALYAAGLAEMVIEHDLMHLETLLYMILQLDSRFKHERPDKIKAALPYLGARSPSPPPTVSIPSGVATIGRPVGSGWGWDNEFGQIQVHVDGFEVDTLPVTVGEFMSFIDAGGYEKPELWREEDWKWREREKIFHPRSLKSPTGADGWNYMTVHGSVAVEMAKHVPVYVSLAEARAYAVWKGKRLPTELEWDRMSFGSRFGGQRDFPWGSDPPIPGIHGNFGFKFDMPVGVGQFPAGASDFGVLDLIGNGWELTETPFGPLPGFQPHSAYPEYSADFFEGKHFVLKGASWATDVQLIRRSFRNWYQSNYPYVFAKFRLVTPNTRHDNGTAV